MEKKPAIFQRGSSSEGERLCHEDAVDDSGLHFAGLYAETDCENEHIKEDEERSEGTLKLPRRRGKRWSRATQAISVGHDPLNIPFQRNTRIRKRLSQARSRAGFHLSPILFSIQPKSNSTNRAIESYS